MTDPITIIGSNTVVSGNLEGDEDLTIEGRVEGSITLSKTLTIEVGGVVRANIHVRNAIISGVLVGNIEAQEAVHITDAGRVVGDIAAPRVILVDGSSFRGNIDMGNFDVERAGGMPAAGARTAPASRTQEPAAEASEGKAEAQPAPTRVRTAPAAAAQRPAARPLPARVSRPAPKPPVASDASSAAKRPPAPKVRSVGKAKAIKKSR
jgi:cytoskeletal protein CcmA (bactofilin family)